MGLIETTTAEGALKGMVLARAPHELGNQEAAYLQDCLVNQPGFVARRGAIQGATSLGNNLSGARPVGVVSTYDPQGNYRIMVLFWATDSSPSANIALWGAIYDSTLTFISKQQITAGFLGSAVGVAVPSVTVPGLWVQSSQGIDGSVIISCGAGYGTATMRAMVKWFGGAPATTLAIGSLSVTLTPAVAVGAVSYTGSTTDIAKLKPGMVLHGYGIIKSIDSTTQLTLMWPSQNTTIAAKVILYGLTSYPAVGMTRGAISVAPTSPLATGYGTKFLSTNYQAGTGGPMVMFLIDPVDGSVVAYNAGATAIPSDTQIAGLNVQLARSLAPLFVYSSGGAFYGFSTAAVQSSFFFEYQRDSTNLLGNLTANFKGCQFFFNCPVNNGGGSLAGNPRLGSRFYITGPDLIESADHSLDGNYGDLISTIGSDDEGVAIQAGRDSVVMCKYRQTWAVTGDDPSNFVTNKIADDGALSANAITTYNGDVIWIGSRGIWRFDGVHAPVNIIEATLGDRWQQLTKAYNGKSTAQDAGTYPLNQCYCFTHRDTLFVNITNTGSAHSVYTDGVARAQNPMQLAIYLPTGAVSFLTNFNFVGYLPGVGPNSNVAYALLVQDSSTTHYLFPMDNLFLQTLGATDAILTVNQYNSGTLGTSVGPWFHMESRKFFAGDGLLRKTWKQLATESIITSTKRMFMETVPGLNTTGTRVSSPFTGVGLWKAIKLRFNSRDQYMSFRLYEDINNRPTQFILGAWQWGYKVARRGQV